MATQLIFFFIITATSCTSSLLQSSQPSPELALQLAQKRELALQQAQEIEQEIKAPNQSTILTHDTKIYGVPFKDIPEQPRNSDKSGIKTDKIEYTAIVRFNWLNTDVNIIEDVTPRYPEFYNKKLHDELEKNIAAGTALLCNNMPLHNTHNAESTFGIVLHSKKPSDCDKLRKFMKKNRVKEYIDLWNKKQEQEKK